MYIQECYSEDLREEVHQALKILGVKSSLKKLNSKLNLMSSSKRLFNTPLTYLDKQPVLLRHSGAVVHIPSFVINVCNHLRSDLAVEGIFRKAGSASRQKEIQARLENGEGLSADDHVIDVAVILKKFLRELPEPLIPHYLHETLLKCLLLKGREVETVLMSCLLLPAEHMDCLTYLIEFLNEVVALKDFNKMSSTNLAIVFAPNIMPIKNSHSQVILNQNTSNHTKIIKILLDSACLVGSVPDFICEKLSIEVQNNPRRRRNSGSLTRMFSGFKKMVGKVSSSTSDSHLNTKCAVPGTPSNPNPVVPVLSAKKRKVLDVSTPFSLKKRREVLRCLPEETLLPKSPMVPKCFSSRLTIAESQNCGNKSPDSDVFLRSQGYSSGSRKDLEASNESSQHLGRAHNHPSTSGSQSGLSKLSNFSRRKLKSSKLSKCTSFPELTAEAPVENDMLSTPRRLAMSQDNCYSQFLEENFVRVPKKEYEDIKSRLSEIESRISAEFTSIGVPLSDSDGSQEDLRLTSKVDDVQSQYRKTLRQTERLSDNCTDSIAQHLSRELKIRHSSGSRVMRSPSQRKIGSIRRRSQERVPRKELSRHMSLNLHKAKTSQLYRSRSLQRGRPNSVSSGLQQVNGDNVKVTRSLSASSKKPELKNKPQQILKNAAVVKTNSTLNAQPSAEEHTNIPHDSGETWKSAQSFLAGSSSERKSYLLNSDRRESIKQIRTQNAGMVMEKAKMFSTIGDRPVIGAPPRRTQSTGNFVTYIKLNQVDTNSHVNGQVSLNSGKRDALPRITEPAHFPGKENLIASAKDVSLSPSIPKTPVSSFLHRNHRQVISPNSSGKKKQLNRQVVRTQSERGTPHKTVIAIGTPRRSPRLNELKKY